MKYAIIALSISYFSEVPETVFSSFGALLSDTATIPITSPITIAIDAVIVTYFLIFAFFSCCLISCILESFTPFPAAADGLSVILSSLLRLPLPIFCSVPRRIVK